MRTRFFGFEAEELEELFWLRQNYTYILAASKNIAILWLESDTKTQGGVWGKSTDDRPTPRCCLPTGSPLPELRPRGLVEPGQPTWKHSACLCCRCFADNARRCAFVLATEGGLFFNIHKYTQKTVSDQFFANATFSFFSCLFLAAAEVEPGGRVCVGTAATPVQGQSCLLSNFIHHVLVCTAQQ